MPSDVCQPLGSMRKCWHPRCGHEGSAVTENANGVDPLSVAADRELRKRSM